MIDCLTSSPSPKITFSMSSANSPPSGGGSTGTSNTNDNQNNKSRSQTRSPMLPFSRLPHATISSSTSPSATPLPGLTTGNNSQRITRGASVIPPAAHSTSAPNLARSTSLHSRSSQRSISSATSSPPLQPQNAPPLTSKQSRHLSHGAQTRPVPQPTTHQKDAFDMAVASSALSSSSEGLQALLRDHPELVSSSLSRAAGPEYNEVSESTRGSRGGSQKGSLPGTPAEEIAAPTTMSEVSVATGDVKPNLGATGKCQRSKKDIFIILLTKRRRLKDSLRTSAPVLPPLPAHPHEMLARDSPKRAKVHLSCA